MECWSCKSNIGEKRISPGTTIMEGKYWLVEHAYPVKIKGWLVIVLKRHEEALHNLTTNEFEELAQIEAKLTKILYKVLNCEKEYISCYAESDHFYHIHFHVFAKPSDLPSELKGGKSFELLKVQKDEAISAQEIIEFCEALKAQLSKSE